MKQAAASIVFAICAFLATPAPLAEARRQPGKRSPQHERLDEWVGRWIGVGEVKSTSSNAGGTLTYTEDIELLPGGFFLLMHWESKDVSGEDKGITIMGYDSDKKLYFTDTFGSRGDHNSFSGTLEGETLLLNRTNSYIREGKIVKSRYVSRRVSPTVRLFKTEISTDGGPWLTITEGKATRVR